MEAVNLTKVMQENRVEKLSDKVPKYAQGAGRIGQLTPPQYEALLMMVDGYTQQEIADAIGVTQATISNWKNSKVFAREYVKATKTVIEPAMNLLKANLDDAMRTLIAIAQGNSSNNRVQLEAVKHLIKLVLEDTVIKDLMARVEKMEQGANREP